MFVARGAEPCDPACPMTVNRLGPAERALLGGAFAAGYASEAATRHFVAGLSFSAANDLSLALGWPFLLQLEPPAGGDDPVSDVLGRLNTTVPARSWPVDLATRAVRLLASGYLKFPKEAKPESLGAAARSEPFAPNETKQILATLFARPVPGWRHGPWLLNALEALGGGAPVIDGVLDALEVGGAAWEGVNAMPASMVRRLANIVRRLPDAEARVARERAKAVLDRAVAAVPRLLDDDKLGLVPARRLALMLDDPELIRRAAHKVGGEVALHDAVLLPRDAFLDILRKRGKPVEGAEASAQYVVTGGSEALDVELERWPAYGTGTDKAAGHAYALDQYGKFRLPGAVALIADMAAKSAIKADAMVWLSQHADYALPVLESLVESGSPARASAQKALKELAKRLPSE